MFVAWIYLNGHRVAYLQTHLEQPVGHSSPEALLPWYPKSDHLTVLVVVNTWPAFKIVQVQHPMIGLVEAVSRTLDPQ